MGCHGFGGRHRDRSQLRHSAVRGHYVSAATTTGRTGTPTTALCMTGTIAASSRRRPTTAATGGSNWRELQHRRRLDAAAMATPSGPRLPSRSTSPRQRAAPEYPPPTGDPDTTTVLRHPFTGIGNQPHRLQHGSAGTALCGTCVHRSRRAQHRQGRASRGHRRYSGDQLLLTTSRSASNRHQFHQTGYFGTPFLSA